MSLLARVGRKAPWLRLVAGVVLLLVMPPRVGQGEPMPPIGSVPPRRWYDKTLGGRQFWCDVHWFRQWRIQKNAFTGHYRLLDPQDYRHVSGSYQQCKSRLEEIKRQLQLPPLQGTAVVLIHGLGRSSRSFAAMAAELRRQGYTVVPLDYSSTRQSVQDVAECLHQVLESLDGIQRVHLVAHSLGGLVVRAYFRHHRDPRLGRVVLLGVPNQGAELARRLSDNTAYRLLFGPSGHQLAHEAAKLPVPPVPFGVIAGGRGDDKGYNPWIPGDDDGLVGVASTHLKGEVDFLLVRCMHGKLKRHPQVIEAVVRFLHSGRFRSGESRREKNALGPPKVPSTQ